MAARKTLNWFFLGRLTSSAIWIAGPTHSSSPFAPITAHKENTACAEPLAKVEADVALIQTESYTF
ncbi:hypothetical protein SAMN04488500_10219 [Sporomusa malonica]|uniref:Uncharacterized protein n=1 Tax=Sporomusa malonica TaxID=112901 RepID=A0A1W1YPD2_9FIRM|nr:hypothetical protein SAMN04488500_10219 [Sporomusa malonica]